MPQQKEKQKVNANPSPSLTRRMLGGPISESVQNEWPELAKAWADQELRMPRETTLTNRIRPMNRLEKFLSGNQGQAVTYPLTRTIKVNRDVVTQDKNLEDVLVHELTHVGQKPRGLFGMAKNLYTPWEKRPEEIEAMEAERKWNRPIGRDIELPMEPYKGIDTAPTSLKKKKELKNAVK